MLRSKWCVSVEKPYGEGVRRIYPYRRTGDTHLHIAKRTSREMFMGVMDERAGSNRYINDLIDYGYESDLFNDF